MPLFNYKVRDKQGVLTTGRLEAADEGEVISNLDKRGYSVTEVTSEEGPGFSTAGIVERFKHFEKRDTIIFTRQLATLLRSGTALSPALTAVCDQTQNKRFRAVLDDVRQSVQEGKSLSEGMSKHPHVFPELFVSMVEVGEAGGMLDKVLERLAALGMQELDMNSRIKSALVYPIILVIATFAIVNFLVVGVLPKFVTVFRTSGAALPLPTQIIMGLSWILRRLWFPLAVAAGIALAAFRNYTKKERGKFKFHKWLLILPIFGPLYRKVQISRFARATSALISTGVPILQALSVVEKTITNVVVRKAIQDIRFAISEGHSLVEPFRASGLFSPMVIQMISTGEKTGKLDQMLAEIVSFYEPEIEYTVKNLTTLLEPLMLLAMGVMVGFIALSVLLPIFNLIRVFRG
ncbi:MAG: type II secretion system F family protein [Candidatus Omnitrophica bacterium]|nr:type II secretion system F family protein [Candidatus Omnitrophota bacterium]